jgi:hypothetical protein
LNLGSQLAGTRVKIGVMRGEKRENTEVTLAKMHIPGPRIYSECKRRDFDRRGLRVEYASTVYRGPEESSPQAMPQGVLVDEVKKGSAADKAMPRLAPGLLIIKVNDTKINSPAEYLKAANVAGPIDLFVQSVGADANDAQKITLP